MKQKLQIFWLAPSLKLLKWFVITSLIGFLLCWWVIPHFLTIPDVENSYPAESTLILDRNGKPLHHQTREDYLRHRRIKLTDIPQVLIQATLSAEDKRFWSHGGIDIAATMRSLNDAVRLGRFVSGASTITQQTVKLHTDKARRTLSTKIIEAFKARKLEMSYRKEEILELYFNTLEYGNRTQGPYQAALHYFNKPLNQLSIAEYALLAGIPQAPTRHNPRRNPASALKRRNWVLDKMAKNYDFPVGTIARAKAEPLELHSSAPHFSSPELAELLTAHSSSIRTTIDGKLQTNVLKIVQRELGKIRQHNVNNAAVVVIHNVSGEVVSLIGSPDSKNSIGGQFNAALLPRSPGSALKPFTYLMGFEHRGLSPASIIPDIATWYPGERGPEEIVNYDRKHRGPVTIQRALGNSLNIPVVRVLNQTGGPEKLQQYLKKFGFTTLNREAMDYGLGLCIGAGEVTLLEITNAYATLARLGSFLPASLTAQTKIPLRIANSEQCYLIADILSNNHARSHTFGANSHLRLPFTCAAKTGTSTDYKDNFCIGFTKDYTVGVWVGNIDQTPMQHVSGITGAGPIFYHTMMAIHQNQTASWFLKPKGVISCKVDPHTGKVLRTQDPRFTIAEIVKTRRLPEYARAEDYNDGKPILDQRYIDWFKHRSTEFSLVQSNLPNAPEERFKILSPTQEATYFLDPDLPNKGSVLSLQSSSKSTEWSCDSLEIIGQTVILKEGEHQIKAHHKVSGERQTVKFTVQAL